MYNVYLLNTTTPSDAICIHDQKTPSSLCRLQAPSLKMAENTAGTLEFSITPNHIAYDDINRMTSLIIVRKDDNTIWTGRPIKESTDFYGNKKITCEGALAFLNDTLQDPVAYDNQNLSTVFRAMITAHNNKVDANRKILPGVITITDFDEQYFYETNYTSTWNTIKTQFLDRLQGHVSLRYVGSNIIPYIDYSIEYNTSPQEINFGENLLDFTKDYDLSDLFTVIFPKGKEISDSTSGDASDDANPVTTTHSIMINGVVLGYSVITSDTRVTVKITSMTTTNNISYHNAYSLSVVLVEDTLVTQDASYTTSIQNGVTIKHYENAKTCADKAVTKLQTKISKDQTKTTYTRGAKDDSCTITLTVFGKTYSKTITIPAREDETAYLTGVERKEYVTIASVNNGSVYLENATAVARYGRIEREIEFSEIDSPRVLLRLARVYLQALQFGEMSITVSAVDLHYLNPNIVSFNMLDQVRCVSIPHGMDKMFPITEITIPLDEPEKLKYTLGKKTSTSMSTKNVINKNNFYSAIASIPSFRTNLDTAKDAMTSILNQRTTGYVNIVQENDISQAIVISDTPDWLNASRLWKFDINGLGYSDTSVPDETYTGPTVQESIQNGTGGYTDRWYKLGITMDGTIVADVIKTGILSDGVGLNYWNLSTGEFSLQPGSVIIDGEGYSVADLVEDVVTANTNANNAQQTASSAQQTASSAQQTASSAQQTADNVRVSFDLVDGRQYGVVNVLNGTYKISIPDGSSGTWQSSLWKISGGGNGKATIKDCNKTTQGINPPNAWIKKCISMQGSSNHNIKAISQVGIEVEPNTTYCLSCYAFGTGTLHLSIGSRHSSSNNGRYNQKEYTLSNVTKWKRYSLVITTNDASKDNGSKYVGLNNSTLDVSFGNLGQSSTSYLNICAMKLEKGNTPTEWFPSLKDIEDNAVEYTREYVDMVVPQETSAQITAYDRLLTHDKVLKKLTDGFQHVGIYSKKLAGESKPSLLINATYIKTGSLSADIIKTGWIRDQNKKNQWNLKTGYFTTKQMKAVNMQATGIFTTGKKKTHAIQLDSGAIHGYAKGSYISSIETATSIYNIDSRRHNPAMQIRCKHTIDIRCPTISVRNKNDNATSLVCETGTFKFDCVSQIRDIGGGAIQWYTDRHEIRVVNGLIVCYS